MDIEKPPINPVELKSSPATSDKTQLTRELSLLKALLIASCARDRQMDEEDEYD